MIDDAALRQQVAAPDHHFLLELEARDAVDHQPAHAVVAVVHVDLIAALAQLLGRRQPGRTAADYPDRFWALPRRHHPLHPAVREGGLRSEEHTSELQSLMRNSYAVFRMQKKKT